MRSSNSSQTIGARIRELRGEESAFKFGARCKPYIQPNRLYRWEAGDSTPRYADLAVLAEAFGISVAELIEGTTAPAKESA